MGQYKNFMGFLLQEIHVFPIRKREFCSFYRNGCEFLDQNTRKTTNMPPESGLNMFLHL